MEMNPVGQWLRINGYNESVGGFGNIDPDIFFSPITLGEKSQNTQHLAEPKLLSPWSSNSYPNWIGAKLYPKKALGLHDIYNSSQLFQWTWATERMIPYLQGSGSADLTTLFLWTTP